MGGEHKRLRKVVWVLGHIAIDGETELGKGIDLICFIESEFHLDMVLAWPTRTGSIGYIHRVDLHIWVSVRPEVRGGEGCGRAEFNSKPFLDGHQSDGAVAEAGDNKFTEKLG